MDNYKIVRHYLNGGRRVLLRGLSLKEAQEHCNNPETSSKTATSYNAARCTERNGPWFDGYERD